MTLIETYAKELVSLIIPLVTWILNNRFKPKAKLLYALPHIFTFLVQQPLLDEHGEQVRPTQTVHTGSLILRNAGTETAKNVELVFNWKPLCVNIWTPRHFTERIEADNRYILMFESLAPNEILELVAKPHKRFMTIMIQAIWMKASYMLAWCSYRTTMRRKFPNQLNVRSTIYRLL
jgi:hypothetical protein